jgi:signal transduction histidine kinase
MNLSTRSLGLALLLLLLFLGATVTLQWWTARETRQLQAAAIAEQRARFSQAIVVGGLTPTKWDAAFQREFEALLGGRVTLLPPGTEPAAEAGDNRSTLSFAQDLPGASGWRAQVSFAPPAMLRMQVLHQRAVTVIVLLALIVALVPLLLAVISARRPLSTDGGSRAPWARMQAEATGLEQLARISHERTTALAHEHGARVRAEENLEVNRSLLDHSMAERARLGRELHDNICQTLYAVCLTLESVQKKNTLAPALQQRIEQSMVELKRLNQEVRTYIRDLEPGRLQEQTFVGALTTMLTTFAGEDAARIEHHLDEESVARIPAAQTADILNILREAISNAVRHGAARHIILRAAGSDREIALSVQDDGRGFNPDSRSVGHGLANMRTRAELLGGQLKVESAVGKGARVLLTLPVASAS